MPKFFVLFLRFVWLDGFLFLSLRAILALFWFGNVVTAYVFRPKIVSLHPNNNNNSTDMNKNTVIGTILMCLLLFAFMWYNQPTPEQIEEMRRQQDSIQRAQAEAIVDETAKAELAKAEEATIAAMDSAQIAQLDSIKNANLQNTYGSLAAATQGEERTVTLQNDVIRLAISTRGGQLSQAVLLKYDDYQGDTLEVFNAENNDLYYTINTPKGSFNTDKFFFEPVQVSDTSVVMRLQSTDGAAIDFVYRLTAPDSYLVDYSIRFQNADRIINDRTVMLNWYQSLPRTELGRDFEGRYSQLYYKYSGQSSDDLSSTSSDDEVLNSRLCWLSFQNQFFSTMLVSNDLFTAGRLRSEPIKEEQDQNIIKKYSAENLEFEIDTHSADQTIPMCFYIGPKDYYNLKDMSDEAAQIVGKVNEDLDLEDSFYLGWRFIVHYVNSWVIIPLFHLMDKFIPSYGIIILLMTLFIKLITLPMTYKSYKASAKMRIAQQLPEIQAINEKYPNQEDAMQKQQEMMAMYQRIGVNQMGGCLPMLIQWPVLIALFYFFPTSIELRHQPFLWAEDLSTYDAFLTWDANIPVVNWIFGNHLSLFCLLMTATNIFYTWLMQKQNPSQQSMPGMKAMMYLMPLMFLFFLNNYSAGLSYYYFLSTLFGIMITYAIRWSMDEGKILQQMKENLKNPKKGGKGKKASGWVARLQQIQKEQEAQMRKQREEQARKMRR